MALVFERIVTDGLGDLSYLIGDDGAGVAAVIDPRADVDIYLELARLHRVAITHIFQTHTHEDFLSGAGELAARLGNARVCLSGHASEPYGFDAELVTDGDVFRFGGTCLTVRHTPGHTPEHISLLIAEAAHADTPYGVFSGGSLLINAAGRSDLLGTEQAAAMAAAQYHTLTDFYLRLDDHVIVYPTHAHGSPCGAAIGDRFSSTIGYERRFNPFLQQQDVQSFCEFVLGNLPPKPVYYPRLKAQNQSGPEILGSLPVVPPLPMTQFRQQIEAGQAFVLDVRHMAAFGGGHIVGAINIGGSSLLSIWAGWMLSAETPLLLVLDSDEQLPLVTRYLLRTGFTQFAGYLVGGMSAWSNAGLPLQILPQLDVATLHANLPSYQVLDVRSPQEWEKGHIPGAHHVFLPELKTRITEIEVLTKEKPSYPLAVYCGTGYRASIAASLLQQHGISQVCNVPGSWQAWRAAGYPVEQS